VHLQGVSLYFGETCQSPDKLTVRFLHASSTLLGPQDCLGAICIACCILHCLSISARLTDPSEAPKRKQGSMYTACQCHVVLLFFADLATFKLCESVHRRFAVLRYLMVYFFAHICSSNTRLHLLASLQCADCTAMMCCFTSLADAGHHPGLGHCQQVFLRQLCRSSDKPRVNPSQGHCGLWSGSYRCVPKFTSGQKKEGMSIVLKPRR